MSAPIAAPGQVRPLARVHNSIRRLVRKAERRRLRYARWTIPQGVYLRSRAQQRLIRAGNRVGKSWVAVGDAVMRAERCHPHRPDWNARPGPIHVLIVCVTWRQSVPLQKIAKHFISWDRVASSPTWTADKGWGKDSPTIVYDDGSTISFRTLRQGALSLAGAKYHYVLIDEPTTEAVYRELERRTVDTAGELALSMTPVNGGDLSWLRGLVDDGIIEDIHVPMTVEAFTFEDGLEPRLLTLEDGTPRDQAWIDDQRRRVLPAWRPIIIDGEWEGVALDAQFSESFNRAIHLDDKLPDGDFKLLLGLDHGTKAFTETAVLVGLDTSGLYPVVYVLDCYQAEASSLPEVDARGILAMLGRWGWTWSDLDYVCGDIVHYGGGRRKVAKKSNQDIADALVKALGLGRAKPLSPQIVTAKTGRGVSPRGSVYRGTVWLHHAMARPGHFHVHRQAEAVAGALEKWRGGSTDPYGHLVDALRYALNDAIRKGTGARSPVLEVHVG